MKNLEITPFFNQICIPLAKLTISDSPINIKCSIIKLFPKFLTLGKEFTNSKLNSLAVLTYHKIQVDEKLNLNDGYLKEILESLKTDYATMEKAKRQNENIDLSNFVPPENGLKPISRVQKGVGKRARSIAIKLKPSAVIKPVPSHSKLLPRV